MDCRRWDTAPEYILGWRSNSTDEVEQKQGLAEDALDDVKSPQKREYLVKWRGKAFRHATWVPHDYMASVSRGLLLNFLRTGIRVTLATESQIATKDSVIGEDTVEAVLAVDEDGKRGAESVYSVGPPTADPDAREKIPVAWTSLKEGVKPDDDRLVSVNTAERLLKRNFSRNDAAQMIKYLGWVYIKWQDLQYEAGNYLTVPALEGLNWLMAKWHNLQSCILADDMGLGKTVQISAFLAYLGSEAYHVYPHLVVVPNSTLQNWTRELAKWAPHLRVVPYFGEKGSRNVIREYELYHDHRDFHTLKTHVIVTTYEVITSKDFNVFAKIPRWETLIVDEAQRLKAGSSLIFKKLNELNAVHKVLLTGTPLNNTIREILNLMNFLDPREFSDLDGMEKRYSVPDEELYKELRAKIAPFMLRRSKEEVLDLPAKNEIIVPLTMRSLQKQVYRSILERNADLMEALARISKGESKGGKPKRGHIHNMLMQLRKCLQHPFLCNNSLEDYNLEPSARHQALIDGSAKLGFLKAMLPKLRAKGHRILLFSQFKIALDIIEQFFDGEDYKYLRLDGDTPQAKRQKDIDAFNAPDSPYTVFLLSTRAGGVGINLASADTVIIHDLDFNPHLDMQAIARSYRYGQKKTVMVFRLMMAQTVEANIMQASKKKLLLDHLIVQSLRKVEEEDDFATIVLNGAKALFEDKAENDIVYSSEALDNMISELETREKPETQAKTTGFTFAPVYETAQKPAGELPDFPENSEHQDSDFWADVLKRMEDETRAREAELYGAGKRSRGKQISYADHGLDPGNSQEQRRPAETEALHADRVPDDAASQESDYAVEHSDISDAEGVEEIQADTQELADPPSKRAKLAPPKLALHPSNGDIILKKGSNMEGESTGEQVVSVGPAESDAIKKTVRRPRKSKPLPRPNIPSNLGQFPPGPHTAPVNSASQNKLQLARAQITDLRYAAEDCAIPDYVQKTHAIFSLKLNAAARWDAYVKLAGEVDSVLEARGLAPAFMNNESVETVLPLFRAEGNDARKPINSNGRPPKIHKTKPSRPSTAVQSTNSTPSRGAPSPFTVGQRSSYSANAPSQLSTMPQSSIDSAATTLKLATSRRKRKKGFPKSRSQGISAESSTVASKSQEATVRATAKPKDSQRPTGNPGPTCFFCTQSHETTKCPGLSSRAKIGEYAIKVQPLLLRASPHPQKESEGSIADKAQWIRWLTDKERGLRKSEHTVKQHAKMDPSPKPVLRKRSSSSEKKAKADQQKAKEDQEVEKLVGLDDLIVIEDSD
ncbi:hypothetical protein QFC19_008152 [Naganishia cerealis]|uniref:Uncharacterized protein n=1 Tax=Naganishia cerealis TaxID=610337 RepID=A0ACC2V3Z4_9TREE|nr:hypothetical protein QFC19_008152 [Naganishia cerealis]